MKMFYTAILVGASSVAIAAQQPTVTATPSESVTPAPPASTKITEPLSVCDLTMKYSPIVNGLQLHMFEGEAALKLGAKFEADPSDVKRKRVSATLDKNPIFEGDHVVSGVLTSAGEKVTSIRLTYSSPWTSAREFVNKFAPKLGLVRNAFRLDDDKREATIVCKDFTVELKAAGAGSEVVLAETSAPTGSAPKTQ